MPFVNELEAFLKRTPIDKSLIKAVHPNDFSAIIKETDPAGADVVDHTQDLNAHPRSINNKVEHYRSAISGSSPMVRTTPTSLFGVSAKATYSLPRADKMQSPYKVLVKPYHEKLHERAKFWQKHPIQGWAEMTNQSLWHAAGIGHMHQQVHVSEHDMGPGFEKHPAIVVHMDPRAQAVQEMPGDPNAFSNDMMHDIPKIAIMDFLTNNMDRHRQNLLYLPQDARDEEGFPVRSRLLAIDHGRNFQYHASHKGAPKFINDPLIGDIPLPTEEQDKINQEGKNKDNLIHYFDSDALRTIEHSSRFEGNPPFVSPRIIIPAIARWWPNVRRQVIAAMDSRLRGLRESQMSEHIRKNFIERVNLLDKIAARPEWYLTQAEYKDLNVPLHVWDR